MGVQALPADSEARRGAGRSVKQTLQLLWPLWARARDCIGRLINASVESAHPWCSCVAPVSSVLSFSPRLDSGRGNRVIGRQGYCGTALSRDGLLILEGL